MSWLSRLFGSRSASTTGSGPRTDEASRTPREWGGRQSAQRSSAASSAHRPVDTGAQATRAFCVPATAVVQIPIADFTYPRRELRRVSQVSVHSGSSAWLRPLDQDARRVLSRTSVQIVLND